MMNLNGVSLVLQYIKAFYNKTWIERYGESIGAETVTILWSITVSIFAIGGLLGALSVSLIIRLLGRWVDSLALVIKCCSCNTEVLLLYLFQPSWYHEAHLLLAGAHPYCNLLWHNFSSDDQIKMYWQIIWLENSHHSTGSRQGQTYLQNSDKK